MRFIKFYKHLLSLVLISCALIGVQAQKMTVEFINAPLDTVYYNGPFVIKAKVATHSLTGIHNPYLSYTTTLNKVSQKDSIKMTAVEGDSIWTATIPQQRYGTEIFYSIYGKDSAANTAHDTGYCFLKYGGNGAISITDSVIYGTNMASPYNSATPLNTGGTGYNWSKVLYMANMVNTQSKGGEISGIAFYTSSAPAGYTRYHNKIYLKATTQTALTTLAGNTLDPVQEGATLVFNDSFVSTKGWTKIMFERTFHLNPGENLIYYRLDSGGNSCETTVQYYSNNTTSYTAQEYFYSSLSCSSSTSTHNSASHIPTTKFYFGKNNNFDSNSVALVSIDNPKIGTISGKQPVKITLQNKGIKDLTSAKINWMVNGVLQTALTYSGVLPCDFNDTLTLGSYTQKLNGYDTITVWINTPNNAYDSITADDTLEVISYGCGSYLKGDYTVGAGGKYDFPSLKDALFVMNTCGLSGDITLKLANGTYAEALDFRNFANSYNVHITSIAGNADSVIFRPTSKTVVDLVNNRKLKFSHLTFDARKAKSYVVNVGAGCDDVEFYHCVLQGFDTNTTVNTYTNIYKASGGTVNNIRFIGNKILGGTDATYFYGASATAHNTNILFDSNYFAGAYYYHGYFYYTDITFTNNVFEEAKNGYSYYYGPAFYYCNKSRFEGNRVRTHSYASYHYGMRFYYIDSSYICNNEIVVHNNNTTSYGLYFYYPKGTVLANNTVLVYGTASTHYGIYTYLYSGYSGTIRNNISIVNGSNTAYPLYSSSITGVQDFDIDYNCWWNARYVSYLGSAISNINVHKNTLQTAIHDIYFRPNFIDSSRSLKPKTFIGLDCKQMSGVQYDINGIIRSTLTTMGCYTNIPTPNNAALIELLNVNPTSYISDTICPAVVLVNSGSDPLTEATITMEVNNVMIGKDIPWKGNLNMGQMDTLSLSCFVPKVGNNTITAYLTGIGAAKDTIPANDTINLSTFTCNSQYAGTYYVGGSNADFADLNEAAIAIVNCGVSGPVELKMRSGKYAATEIDGIISGASKTNSITVMPDNNASVVIDGGAGIALSLSGTAYWNFEGLTIGNTTNGLIGVNLSPDVKYISFHNCNIYANKTATTNTYKAVSLVNSSGNTIYPEEVSFIHNNISGGYYNMYLYYLSGTTTNMQNTVNITIDSNTLTDAYYYGIYSYYQAHYRSLAHNTVISRSNSSIYYGIYLQYYHNFDQAIEGNRVHVNCSGTGYGIYFYYYKNYSSYGGKSNTFCNNEVIVRGAGAKYGIYFYLPYQTWEVSHNSVYTESSSGTAYTAYLYNSSTSYKINAINNMFVAKGTSPYPIYISSASYVTSSYMTLDYNNYYSIGSSNIGYAGAAKTTLASWQSATGMDKNSTNIRPSFIDSSKNLELNDYSYFICPASNNVTTNIYGKVRSAVTMMGAHSERILEEVDLSSVEFVDPKPIENVVCYADNTDISISITNNGLKVADFSKSPLKVSINVSGAINYHCDTTITRGSIKYMEIDTLYLPSIPTMASGTYNIQIILSDTADKVSENDTITLAHHAYRVELPYDIDFSTRPNEFVSNTMAGKAEWEVVKDTVINPDLAPAFGTGCLFFDGAKNPGAYVNAIFNAINIHNCLNPTLSFWYAHNANCGMPDMTVVLVTTDGGENYTEILRIPAADTATAWKQYNIDLTPFNQVSCLSIVFRGISFGGSNQAIDRIRIKADKDASFELLPIDVNGRTACDNKPVDVKGVLTNKSLMGIELLNDTVTLNVSGASNFNFKQVYNKKLGGLESDTILLGQIDLSVNGYTYIQAYIQSLDDNTANDTAVDSTLYIMQDMAIDSIIGMDEETFKISGDKVSISAMAVNSGNLTAERVRFSMFLDGNEVVTDTVFSPIKPGDTLIHPMSKPYTVPGVSEDQPYYFLEVRVELDCDGNYTNDSIAMVCNVMIPDSIDLQVLDITATTPAKGKTKIAPTVRIANIGNQEASNVVLHVDVIDSSMKIIDHISEHINYLSVNEVKNVVFAMNYTVPNYTGQYSLKAYVEAFSGDTTQSNDTLSKAFASEVDDTRIRESEELNWSMGQNIPNPANSITRIPFKLPQDAEVVFSVMSANGQLIYHEQISAHSGNNTLKFDVNKLANGIYYYSMEYQGQRIVKKMNVAK